MAGKDTLVRVRNLKTQFFLREGVVRACDGVDLSIERGMTLGVVGESGCGKSVTAQSIMRIVPKPGRIVAGDITLYQVGKQTRDFALTEEVKITDLDPMGLEMRSLRGQAISMIFQEPMACFSPVRSIGVQISEAVLLHQEASKRVAEEMVIDMLARVGIAAPAQVYDSYPHQLSGGMLQRAMITMALMCNPSLLIADEPTTALDVTTEAQILRLMRKIQKDMGMAIMFITHDLGVIAEMANEVVVMYMGKVVESGEVDAIYYDPKHPYLRSLLKSIPRIGAKTGRRLESIKGMVPDPFHIPPGCPFHPRCPEFMPGICDLQIPPYVAFDEGMHTTTCHFYATEAAPSKRGGE